MKLQPERTINMPDGLKTFNSFYLPWRDLPGSLPEDIDIFAIGDVHGQAELLEQVLGEIKNTPREAHKRHLVFLGDLIDRGSASIRAVDLAMRAGQLADVDVLHVLPGNHDLVLMLTLDGPKYLDFWGMLGGDRVMAELGLSAETHSWDEIAAKLKDNLHPEYLRAMASGPTHLYLGDLLFVHAGIHPFQNRTAFLGLSRRFIKMEDHWANIRHTFLTHRGGWDVNDPDPERRAQKPTVVVHGHTPAVRQDLVDAGDLDICDGVDDYRTVALDIGAAYRPQLAFAHFRTRAGQAEVQIRAVGKSVV
jgi:serine/threonine protein phosphatase 1